MDHPSFNEDVLFTSSLTQSDVLTLRKLIGDVLDGLNVERSSQLVDHDDDGQLDVGRLTPMHQLTNLVQFLFFGVHLSFHSLSFVFIDGPIPRKSASS